MQLYPYHVQVCSIELNWKVEASLHVVPSTFTQVKEANKLILGEYPGRDYKKEHYDRSTGTKSPQNHCHRVNNCDINSRKYLSIQSRKWC